MGNEIIGELKYNKNPFSRKFMIAAFPTSDEAKIFDYNRVVKDLNGLQKMIFRTFIKRF